MSGRVAYERESYAEDIRAGLARGMTISQVAAHLGMSRATVYRILAEHKRASR